MAPLIIDETYKDFVYLNDFHSPLEREDIEEYDNLLVVRSFSKSLGICGWRLGYSISSSKTAKKLKQIQSTMLIPPSSLVQYAISESLELIESEYYEQNRSRYERRMKILVDDLNNSGMDVVMPNGGFYLFLDLSDFFKKSNKYNGSLKYSRALAEEKGILVWPGIDFGNDNCVRISISLCTNESIYQGICGIISTMNE